MFEKPILVFAIKKIKSSCSNHFEHITSLSIYLFFVIPGLELRAYTLSHSPAIYVLSIFKIGLHKLFAWDGFKPRSS
jgi:hypothetical protein